MRGFALTLVVLLAAPAVAQGQAIGLEGADPFEVAEAGRITVSVPYAFALEEAVARLGHLLAYWKERFHIAAQWRGNRVWLSGALFGLKVNAVFTVNDGEVVAIATDPGWPWRGKAEGYVEQKLKKYLHPTYADP